MTAGLVASSCTKDRLHKKWLKTRSILVETKYKSYGKLFKQVANAAEASYCKCQFDTTYHVAVLFLFQKVGTVVQPQVTIVL